MMRQKGTYLIFLLTIMVSFACEKVEGPGGAAEIYGRVWVRDYDNANFLGTPREYWAEEEDVYLMYGSDTIYSDRTRTNFDGTYRFQELREGDYKIYAYSKDSTYESESYRIPIFETVHVGSDDGSYEVPTITVLK